MAKQLHKNTIIGQQGIVLIEKIVLSMGWVWNPRGQLETGIDGTIEIRDAVTGSMSNQLLLVQSKAGDSWFRSETEIKFEFLCDKDDLHYWLQGNIPVLLIVSRPEHEEAYWVSVKDYFQDLSRLKTRKIVFDKQTQRFSVDAKAKLEALAVPKNQGVYHAPALKQEKVYSNLLPVVYFPDRLYIAPTSYTGRKDIFEALKPRFEVFVPAEWILRNKMILSFHDLGEPPWNTICDEGAVEIFDTKEWGQSDNIDRRYEFSDLLIRCLRERTYKDLRLYEQRGLRYFYFKPTPSLTPRSYSYKTVTGRTQDRLIFRPYYKKSAPDEIIYYRHFAFEPFFKFYDSLWYLEITPTYHYTTDGETVYPYREDQLSGIKRLEQNQSILGQVVMWAHYLAKQPPLFDTYKFLKFGDLMGFDIDFGIDDDTWLSREDDEIDNSIAMFDDDDSSQKRLL
ncbi:MAG: hypothetical protein BroJett018_20790 [Chloroflexota bacterium]|nr:MAG: hypothetical protein BroJett018_20790 [Chloroflexota bacterium]